MLPKLKARGVSEDEIHTLLVKIRLVFFTEDTHISLPKAGADSGPVPSSYVLAFWLCNKEEKWIV